MFRFCFFLSWVISFLWSSKSSSEIIEDMTEFCKSERLSWNWKTPWSSPVPLKLRAVIMPKMHNPHSVTFGVGAAIFAKIGVKPAQRLAKQKHISRLEDIRCGYILELKIINYEFISIPTPMKRVNTKAYITAGVISSLLSKYSFKIVAVKMQHSPKMYT